MLFLTPEAGICRVFCRGVFWLFVMFVYSCTKISPRFVQIAQITNFQKYFEKKACNFLSGVLKYNHQIKAVELLI